MMVSKFPPPPQTSWEVNGLLRRESKDGELQATILLL